MFLEQMIILPLLHLFILLLFIENPLNSRVFLNGTVFATAREDEGLNERGSSLMAISPDEFVSCPGCFSSLALLSLVHLEAQPISV